MIADAFAAYAHFISIFFAFSCLTAELIFYRPAMPAEVVRRVRRIDAGYALAAAAIVATGFIRAALIGKGIDHYVPNGMFWIKMALVVLVILLSAVPTAHFRRLPRRTPSGTVTVEQPSYRRVRRLLWVEAALLSLIPLFAAFAARGIGLG